MSYISLSKLISELDKISDSILWLLTNAENIHMAPLNFHLSRNSIDRWFPLLPTSRKMYFFLSIVYTFRWIFTIWQQHILLVWNFFPLILKMTSYFILFFFWIGSLLIEREREREKKNVIISFTRCARSHITLLSTWYCIIKCPRSCMYKMQRKTNSIDVIFRNKISIFTVFNFFFLLFICRKFRYMNCNLIIHACFTANFSGFKIHWSLEYKRFSFSFIHRKCSLVHTSDEDSIKCISLSFYSIPLGYKIFYILID